MKNVKTYTMVVKGVNLTYGYSVVSKKWEFKAPGHTFMLACKGASFAHKVANILAGGIKRVGQIDNMSRANINKLMA